MEKKGRGKRLMLEVGLLMIVFFVVSTGIVVNHINEEFSEVYVISEGSQVMDFMSLQMKEMGLYDVLPWLVDYWQDHCDEMDFSFPEENDLSWLITHDNLISLLFGNATVSAVEALPEEIQKVFAEVIYVSFGQFVDQIGKTTDVTSLHIVKGAEDRKAFVFFSWEQTDEEKEPALGQILPDIWDLQSGSPSISANNYVSETDNLKYVRVSCPLTYNDEVLFSVCYDIPESVLMQNLRDGVKDLDTVDILLLLVTFAVMMTVLFFFIIRPLVTMQKSVHHYTETRDREGIEKSMAPVARLPNEIGYLANEFIDMTGQLHQYVQEIRKTTAEKERNATELALARKIQMDAMPNRFPLFPGETSFDFHAFIEPTKAVGGDFYDVFMPDKTHVVLVAADVSDKGIPAALFMMRSRTVIRDMAASLQRPSKILEKCNKRLCENNEEQMFVTVWLGIVDLKTGELVCAQAGHEPLIVRQGGVWKLEDCTPGCPLGAIPGEEYYDASMTLSPGDFLFEYTDGVTEARNREQQMYRINRLLEALNRGTGETPEDVILDVKKDLYAFVDGAEQVDDITMTCFRFRGKKTE